MLGVGFAVQLRDSRIDFRRLVFAELRRHLRHQRRRLSRTTFQMRLKLLQCVVILRRTIDDLIHVLLSDAGELRLHLGRKVPEQNASVGELFDDHAGSLSRA